MGARCSCLLTAGAWGSNLSGSLWALLGLFLCTGAWVFLDFERFCGARGADFGRFCAQVRGFFAPPKVFEIQCCAQVCGF